MMIKHSVEKEDGSVVFQGVLEGKELSFVIEIGLEALIKGGMVPFTATNEFRNAHDVHDIPDMEQ